MARAKRTDRAEARRRYRASIGEDIEPLDLDEDELDGGTSERSAKPAAAPAPARPSITGAFRNSFRPLDLRADLRALPALLLNKSVWLPVLLTAASTVAFLMAPDQIVSVLLFQYFVYTPPVAAIFLAGFMAPRASYLTGAIAGAAGAIGVTIVGLASIGQKAPDGTPVTQAAVMDAIGVAIVTSIMSGIFFGGAAGWYRRFLQMANPNRAQRAAANRPGGRPTKRGSDGRPLLARRR